MSTTVQCDHCGNVSDSEQHARLVLSVNGIDGHAVVKDLCVDCYGIVSSAPLAALERGGEPIPMSKTEHQPTPQVERFRVYKYVFDQEDLKYTCLEIGGVVATKSQELVDTWFVRIPPGENITLDGDEYTALVNHMLKCGCWERVCGE